jgi:hypothetical protein
MTAAACGAREPADPAADAPRTLEELAAAWSGGRTDPTCQPHGPRGEDLGPLPGSEYCQWPTVVRGRQSSTVSGMRNALSGSLVSLTWERAVPDSAAVARLRDSLGTAFRAWGLAEHPCRSGGRRWQTATFGAEFAAGVRGRDGRLRVLVFATTLPAALTPVTCPGAPTLPPAMPRRSPNGRRAVPPAAA